MIFYYLLKCVCFNIMKKIWQHVLFFIKNQLCKYIKQYIPGLIHSLFNWVHIYWLCSKKSIKIIVPCAGIRFEQDSCILSIEIKYSKVRTKSGSKLLSIMYSVLFIFYPMYGKECGKPMSLCRLFHVHLRQRLCHNIFFI